MYMYVCTCTSMCTALMRQTYVGIMAKKHTVSLVCNIVEPHNDESIEIVSTMVSTFPRVGYSTNTNIACAAHLMICPGQSLAEMYIF